MTTHFFVDGNTARSVATFSPEAVSVNTASIPEAELTLEACTTTGSSSTSTILVTLVKIVRNKFHYPIVNLDKLWSMVPHDVKDKALKEGKAPVLDVTQFGYFKVLGNSVLPQGKLVVVKTKLISKGADKKIKENGDVVLLSA